MKKGYRWAGIIGGLIIAMFLIGLATVLSNPADNALVNIANIAANVLWIVAGALLIYYYYIGKQAEEAGANAVARVPDSPEDIAYLKTMRTRIIGFALLYEVIGSVGVWILNDYSAGATLINIEVIIDVLINLVILYTIVELFRNKKDVLMLALYAMVAMGVTEGVLTLLRKQWIDTISIVLMVGYFVFAILMPVNRRNHRIANFMILPGILIVSIGLSTLDATGINKLMKQESLLEQQYATQTDSISGAYQTYLQKDAPSKQDLENVKDYIVKRDQKMQEVRDNLAALQVEYRKELPSVPQVLFLERVANYLAVLDINKAQTEKLNELMDYSAKVNFAYLTDKQRTDIKNLKQAIDDFNTKNTEAMFKMNTSAGSNQR